MSDRQRDDEAADVRGMAAWGALAALVCGWLARLEPNLVEEGLILHVAQRLVRGEHLFRDVASFTGPLPFELLAALFRVFGQEIAVARAAVVVLQGLACAAIYGTARLAGAGPLSHAAAAVVVVAPVLLFPLQSIFFHTTLAYQLALIAAYPIARGARVPRWAVAAGVCVSLVALCKQTIGAVLALGAVAGVALLAPSGRRGRRAGAVALGGALVALPTLAIYAVRGDLSDLWESLVVLPLSFDETFASPYMNLWPPGRFGAEHWGHKHLYIPSLWTLDHGLFDDIPAALILLTQALYALPFAALLATLARGLRGGLAPAAWLHAVLLVALTANLFPRSDWGHLLFALPSAFVQLLLVAGSGAGSARRTRALAVALVLGLAVSGAAAARVIASETRDPSLGPRVPLRPVTKQMRSKELRKTVEYLRQNARPGEAIFVARSEPLLYFATGTSNPTPYSGVIPGMRAEQEHTILEALEDVRFVLMSDIDQPLYTYYRDELPGVQRYLERYFEVVRVRYKPSWMSLLHRVPDRGPTAIDLFERAHEGRPWILDDAGERQPATVATPVLATKLNRRPLATVLGPRGGGIDFELDLPESSRFQVGVGIAALIGVENLYEHGEDCRIEVGISRGRGFYPLLAVKVLTGDHKGYWWYPLEADLGSFGGERVTLRLSATRDDDRFEPEEPGHHLWAFWGSPRIAVPPPGGWPPGAAVASGPQGVPGGPVGPGAVDERRAD